MKKFVGIFLILIFLATNINVVSAHSGRTDRLGGHFRRADCTYMFHHPTAAVSGKSKAKIVSLIIQFNSDYRCTETLTINKVDWTTVRHK